MQPRKSGKCEAAHETTSAHAVSGDSLNVGWMLLRPLLCFEVILEHFWHVGDGVSAWQLPFDYMLSLAVPVFLFIAFFLGEKHISAGESGYMRKRVWRLAWPLAGWALIYAAVIIPMRRLSHSPQIPTWIDVVWQAVTGHSPVLNPSMWFQSVLLFITVAFFLTFRKLSRQTAMVLLCLLCGAFLFEYSGLNEYLFGNLRFELKYPLGRIAEMIPFAVMGYACSRFSLLERSPLGRVASVIIFMVIAILAMIPLHGDKNAGFGYSNIFYIPAAVGLAVAMWYMPFPRIGRKTMTVLKFLSSFTLGIYCVHRLVMLVLKYTIAHGMMPRIDTFCLCILAYILSFIFCWLLSRIPSKYARNLVK